MGVPGLKVRSTLDRYKADLKGIVTTNASFPQVIPGALNQGWFVDNWG